MWIIHAASGKHRRKLLHKWMWMKCGNYAASVYDLERAGTQAAVLWRTQLPNPRNWWNDPPIPGVFHKWTGSFPQHPVENGQNT